MSGPLGALTPVALRAPSVSAPEELSTLLKTGTFYFALTVRREPGIGRVHRIPPVGLKCLSPKRRKEMTALLGGEQGSRRPA